ncbi:helix-turn-helix domain-containing protein [Parasulfitobacter algicola]|uniref:Helix-turn-helix transcriptional regulator n=1 Tax=Parasulfitobacter algicola TaxID=2614809 RepID=A0ABX2IML9_9RHOB|nr:helix-turn-helix transcriptional regulator [Sulfitobacter algicola]NSX54124.1 helix-turn-helix transcriptional regulator [Sulfitobacter algicola]
MAKTIRSKGHETLCQALIEARKSAGLTQAELADRLRCHQSFVARIESGERRIDVVELIVLTRALGIAIEDTVALVEHSTPKDHRI